MKQANEAFAELVRPHLSKLYRLAYRLTGSQHDAEDLVQDVLVKVYARRDELTSIRELSPWLGRVIYNQFIDDKRRYGRTPLKLVGSDADVEDLAATANGSPANAASLAEARGRIIEALEKIAEEQRVVLVLHDVEGYKFKEIHELTGVPVGTLKSRLSRARARLRVLLEKDGTFSESSSCNPLDGAQIDAL
ncbi:MAG: RNA polymerase sigma factor [Gammaproteobacteria bacterium]|nr:RNA polymerase sigma factor [Gammaproteobacteria bacterium]